MKRLVSDTVIAVGVTFGCQTTISFSDDYVKSSVPVHPHLIHVGKSLKVKYASNPSKNDLKLKLSQIGSFGVWRAPSIRYGNIRN